MEHLVATLRNNINFPGIPGESSKLSLFADNVTQTHIAMHSIQELLAHWVIKLISLNQKY